MKAVLSAWQESATCTWCEKVRECIVVTFSDRFLEDSPLCWKCLQTSFKVRSRQKSEPRKDGGQGAGKTASPGDKS